MCDNLVGSREKTTPQTAESCIFNPQDVAGKATNISETHLEEFRKDPKFQVTDERTNKGSGLVTVYHNYSERFNPEDNRPAYQVLEYIKGTLVKCTSTFPPSSPKWTATYNYNPSLGTITMNTDFRDTPQGQWSRQSNMYCIISREIQRVTTEGRIQGCTDLTLACTPTVTRNVKGFRLETITIGSDAIIPLQGIGILLPGGTFISLMSVLNATLHPYRHGIPDITKAEGFPNLQPEITMPYTAKVKALELHTSSMKGYAHPLSTGGWLTLIEYRAGNITAGDVAIVTIKKPTQIPHPDLESHLLVTADITINNETFNVSTPVDHNTPKPLLTEQLHEGYYLPTLIQAGLNAHLDSTS